MAESVEILCVSNGHGEDRVGAYVGAELLKLGAEVTALPLVGLGSAYQHLGIAVMEDLTQTMPSGGFVRMDGRHLWRDLRSGLLGLTGQQYRAVWRWSRLPGRRLVLAVGDIVPLLFAWLASHTGGCPFAFIATAKSEYYWRDRHGKLPDCQEPFGGSVFFPWERWLMGSRRCKAFYVRDRLTAEVLNQRFFRGAATYLGNPMMDGLEPQGVDFGIQPQEWAVALLPGSRPPEAYENWLNLLVAAQVVARAIPTQVNAQLMAQTPSQLPISSADFLTSSEQVVFLAAIAPSLDLEELGQLLLQRGWTKVDDRTYRLQQARLKLVTEGFSDCLHRCHVGLAMAGTATEQLVGLGKPAIAMPGRGPQYTAAFAREQSRLLGPSLILADRPAQVGDAIAKLLQDPDYFQLVVQNGLERMGEPGASARIAGHLLARLGTL